ncbi:MAG: cell developmental protein SirA [Saccharospirillaceae bacterium]|nr:cell developmental protein SirA [Saccharospirillaceae bacterium]MCD8531219.1 cell developmental protein SirA [Saccharospirillaceae bacterium]
MTSPVTVRYMSRAEIERLMYSLSADSNNEQAQLFEALVRRLLEIMEQESR